MIRNATKDTVLANKCVICSNLFTRGLGLMFRKKITPTILAFRKSSAASIHTFFMRKSIDVLFLDDCCRVTDLVRGLQPRKFYKPVQKAVFVLELPAGSIAKSRTAVGDVINFK